MWYSPLQPERLVHDFLLESPYRTLDPEARTRRPPAAGPRRTCSWGFSSQETRAPVLGGPLAQSLFTLTQCPSP